MYVRNNIVYEIFYHNIKSASFEKLSNPWRTKHYLMSKVSFKYWTHFCF
jgi:hypothetical protein